MLHLKLFSFVVLILYRILLFYLSYRIFIVVLFIILFSYFYHALLFFFIIYYFIFFGGLRAHLPRSNLGPLFVCSIVAEFQAMHSSKLVYFPYIVVCWADPKARSANHKAWPKTAPMQTLQAGRFPSLHGHVTPPFGIQFHTTPTSPLTSTPTTNTATLLCHLWLL